MFVISKQSFNIGGTKKDEDVDVDDPDFWLKVMPDLKTPEMMERKYENLDTEDPESVREFFTVSLMSRSMVDKVII